MMREIVIFTDQEILPFITGKKPVLRNFNQVSQKSDAYVNMK